LLGIKTNTKIAAQQYYFFGFFSLLRSHKNQDQLLWRLKYLVTVGNYSVWANHKKQKKVMWGEGGVTHLPDKLLIFH